MARNTLLSIAGANAAANGVGAALTGGLLRLYAGVIPQTADTALNQNTLLLEWHLATPAFGAAANGQIAVNSVADATGLATADATFLRLLTAGGAVLAQDTVGDVDLGGEWGLILTTRHVVQNVIAPLVGLTYTQPT